MTVAVSWPAELTMEGEFSLGTRENPAYKVMRANQILAAPHGFVWKLTLPRPVPISGSDATYPTTPYRTLVGHSYRGLFNVNTLLQRPELFARSNSCLR